MHNPVRFGFRWIVNRLAGYGVVDADRGRRVADLSWPRFLTMFARKSQRVADVAMVGLAVGPTGIAGLAFANVFWQLGNGFSLGLAGGTISQVSQRFGAENYTGVDLAIKQSVWIGVLLALPFTIVYWSFAEPLIGLLSGTAGTTEAGGAYLRVLSVAMVFNFLNTIASRTLAGADDTWIAMTLRATGGFANIVFNAVFIFGLGMGVRGAALGTVCAELLVTTCFAWGFLSGGLPVVGRFPVSASLGPPYLDLRLSKQLVRITPPLMARSLGKTIASFPLFALLAVFGPTVVAAFEVGRRIRGLMASTGSGFAMAASSLVGQELGKDDESEAEEYTVDVIRIAAVVYLATAAGVILLAGPLSHVFTDDPGVVDRTTPFIRVASISFLGGGMERTFTGILRAAGDNQWPMYGRLVGQYLALLPITYLGVITPLGVLAVYVALVAETWSGAIVTGHRVRSGAWKSVSRRLREEVEVG